MGRLNSPSHELSVTSGITVAEGGIRSDHIVKRFGGRAALKGVSFWAPPGEVTLLAGRNGAGKTTWMRIAAGLTRADQGSVSFAGDPVDMARDSLAVVSDEPPVYGRFNGRANLRLLSGRRRPPASRLREVQNMLGLDDSLLGQRAKSYSLGQRRRLAIGCALLREPRFLFLDEPTIGFDPVAWAAVREALRESASGGATVLLTGQDFDELETACNKIVVLADGVIVFEGQKAALKRRRPPRVRVVTAQGDELQRRVTRPSIDAGPSTAEFPCRDMEDARRTLHDIRETGTEFAELSIVEDTLEQAFLAIHEELGGRSLERPA